jgi:GTPase
MAQKPIVALVGRPNVGKSTLFNRLVGERMAVTHDIPGTTRDRLYGTSDWNGIPFTVIDTGGIEVYQPSGTRNEDPLAEGSHEFIPLIQGQALQAVEDADVIILVTNIEHGITAADESVAEILRQSGKPVLVACNKADDIRRNPDALEFYGLGLGTVVPISAIHGLGVGDLLDELTLLLRQMAADAGEPDESDEERLKIAIVGRPNAGKSTLLNRLLGEERAIVSPIAGTTRDAIDSEVMWHGEKVTLIDTAGIRRRGRIDPAVEKYSVVRAMKAIERCDVALLVIDGELGVTEQDEHIAGYITEAYKSLVLIVNKWDAIEKDSDTLRIFSENVRERLHFVPYAPLIFISALTGQRIHEVLETAKRVWEARYTRIQTSDINRVLRDAIANHPPPGKGTRTLKLFYGSQVRVDPPVFLFHANDASLIHFSYERYLENQLRAAFTFEGTPIRLSFRNRQRTEDDSVR